MHCSDEEQDHSKNFFKSPHNRAENSKTDGVPICKECGADMKPHCMFFDENYSEHYYRSDSVKEYLKDCDCLIVIGTALETGLAKSIVSQTLHRKDVPVIEVNLESSIAVGYNLRVLEKSEIALPAMFNEYYKLKKGKVSPKQE